MPAAGAGAGRCRRCGAVLVPGGRFCPQCAAPVEVQAGDGNGPLTATQVAPAVARGAASAAAESSGGRPAARSDPRRVVIPPTVLEVAAPAVAGGGPGPGRPAVAGRPAAVLPTMIESAPPAHGVGGAPAAMQSGPADRIGWGAALTSVGLLLLGMAAAVAAQFIPWERWL